MSPIIILFFGLTVLFVSNIRQFFYNQNQEIDVPQKRHNKPLIVLCTDFHFEKFLTHEILYALKKCPYQCQISDNLKEYRNADVAVFHARNMTMSEEFHSNTNSNRLNVFYSMEAYPHERIRRKRFPKNFFNVTMTFRRDSTIWKPYDRFEKILDSDHKNKSLIWREKELQQAIAKKTNLAVQIVSHCETYSLREKFTPFLERYINISTYGVCNNKYVKGMENKILEKHFFYLAFENAVCDEYITEKFWRLKQLIVPVVMKRSILKGIVEDDFFIAADDFDLPEALAKRLIYLSQNLSEYKKYFGWIKKYKKKTSNDEREFCRLCEMAVKREKHQINDIFQWWENETKCYFNPLKYSLKNKKFNYNKI